jgi:hypothetical protein
VHDRHDPAAATDDHERTTRCPAHEVPPRILAYRIGSHHLHGRAYSRFDQSLQVGLVQAWHKPAGLWLSAFGLGISAWATVLGRSHEQSGDHARGFDSVDHGCSDLRVALSSGAQTKAQSGKQ